MQETEQLAYFELPYLAEIELHSNMVLLPMERT